MAQFSIPWGGIATGDAGPYTDIDWSDMWRKLFTVYRESEGPLAGYANMLEVTNPAGVTIRVASGAGMVDGKYYENTANVDFTLAAPAFGKNRYDLVVLQKTMATQLVRLAIVSGVEDAVPAVPALTQDTDTIWEVSLARVYITDIPVITLLDLRRCMRFASQKLDDRQGGGLDWNTSGTTNYMPTAYTRHEVGANTVVIGGAAYTATVTVTFPTAFAHKPVVFVSSNNADYIVQPTTISATQVVITATHRDATVGAMNVVVFWMAVGPRS